MSELERKSKTQLEIDAARFNEKRHLDKVIPVRLSGEKWNEIKKEAKELGLSASVLARMWIFDGLRRQRAGLEPLEQSSTITVNRLLKGHDGNR